MVGPEFSFTPLPPDSPQPKPDLRNLDVIGLYDYISAQLIPIETGLYQNGNTSEHTLIFLVGKRTKNISRERTSDGKAVYSRPPSFVRYSETMEAMSAIATYLHTKENSPEEEYGSETLWSSYVDTMGEIADVAYNLAKLIYLDKPSESDVYKSYIQRMAQTLGLDVKDLLLLAVLKYSFRLETNKGKKNSIGEQEFIGRTLGSGIIPRPSDENLNDLHDEIDFMEQELKPRVLRIEKGNMF